ncbi:MAG: hypothetical protein AAF317_00860 [Pseudomonadota bacterium]
MATGVQSLAVGIVDAKSIPAVAKVGPNARVTTQTAPVGVVGDVVTFPPPVVLGDTVSGTWTLGSTRVLASGFQVVTQTALSVTVTNIAGVPGPPMRVQFPDFRVTAI